MRPPRSTGESAGFTLIELVISGALMSLILVSAYACLQAGFSSQRLIEPRIEAAQTARVALALITADLRSACPLAKDSEFIGMDRTIGDIEADNLDFATHHFTPRRPGEGDYCQVSYFLDRDADTGQLSLWRRRNPAIALDPLTGGRREEIAQGVRQLKFEYYDGFDWYDTWGDPDGRGSQQSSWRTQPNLSGMPEAVRITLALDIETPRPAAEIQDQPSRAPPLVFQTVARLNLATPSTSGTPGGTSSNSGQSPSGSSSPSPSEGGSY